LTLLLGCLNGCAPQQPIVSIAIIGPRDGASTLRLGFFLDGGGPEVQTVNIATKQLSIDFPKGTRGEVDVFVFAVDTDGCRLWEGTSSATISDDTPYSITIALAQDDPPIC
jgi:hypothetical protein